MDQAARRLHAAIATGDETGVHAALAAGAQVDARDADDWTALMHAVVQPSCSKALVDRLLHAGADPNASTEHFGARQGVLAKALGAGDPDKVAVLIAAGADLHYDREGYGAMLDALHDRLIRDDARLLDLLRILVGHGVRSDAVTRHDESPLRVLSRVGRFDGVALLLAAGADAAQLHWTPLIRAVAIGSLNEVEAALAAVPDLEARDVWSRSAWLVAVLSGDVARAARLQAAGADTDARGRCGSTALMHAVDSRSIEMLRYVLDLGHPVDGTDEFGGTALAHAADAGFAAAVDVLLSAGSQVDRRRAFPPMPLVAPDTSNGGLARWLGDPDDPENPLAALHAVFAERLDAVDGRSALHDATDPEVIRRLLAAGADPADLGFEGRRALLVLRPEPSTRELVVERGDFARGHDRRYGGANPQRMDDPYWIAMIRAGVSSYQARTHYGAPTSANAPGWCAQRFGQSLTELPDGRIVQVAGEHEDSYDPDFCIYNDVFVHSPDGSIAIYGYPEDVFPPTDFHSATLVGDVIWLIGALGYHGRRRAGFTPVYTLDTRSFRIDAVPTHGDSPGWIYRHQAMLRNGSEIVIQGGYVHDADESQRDAPLAGAHVLELGTGCWRRASVDRV